MFALRQLLEQPVKEPVAWITEVKCVGPEYGKKIYGALPVQSLQPGYYAHTPLYTTPPAPHPQRKPMNDEKYNELLFAVNRKYPGESRHETALRYIRQAEEPSSDASAAPTQGETK